MPFPGVLSQWKLPRPHIEVELTNHPALTFTLAERSLKNKKIAHLKEVRNPSIMKFL